MLLRRDARGPLAIGQPSHAWISGQLARSWGNHAFPAPDPHEEVCLAAEQHDIGMAGWDLRPTRNPDTGLPHAFTEMPLPVHLELWRNGPRQLVRQSRYAALLVSMHGVRLYERRDLSALPASEADAVRRYLEEHRRFQDELLATLRADPISAAAAGSEAVARNSQLIWTWDWLSLAICLDWAPIAIKAVPTVGASAELSLSPGGQAGELTLDPWPFARAALTVRCEGQRLPGRAESQDELERTLTEARWETLEFALRPGDTGER